MLAKQISTKLHHAEINENYLWIMEWLKIDLSTETERRESKLDQLKRTERIETIESTGELAGGYTE